MITFKIIFKHKCMYHLQRSVPKLNNCILEGGNVLQHGNQLKISNIFLIASGDIHVFEITAPMVIFIQFFSPQ